MAEPNLNEQKAYDLFMDDTKWKKCDDRKLIREMENACNVEVNKSGDCYQAIVTVGDKIDYCDSFETLKEAKENAWEGLKGLLLLWTVSNAPSDDVTIVMDV